MEIASQLSEAKKTRVSVSVTYVARIKESGFGLRVWVCSGAGGLSALGRGQNRLKALSTDLVDCVVV